MMKLMTTIINPHRTQVSHKDERNKKLGTIKDRTQFTM